MGFRLHCDDNEMKDIKSQRLKFTFKVSFVKKMANNYETFFKVIFKHCDKDIGPAIVFIIFFFITQNHT